MADLTRPPTGVEDLSFRHYRPAGRTTWCGAIMRAVDRTPPGQAGGEIAKLKLTTDVAQVTCPWCLEKLRATIADRITHGV